MTYTKRLVALATVATVALAGCSSGGAAPTNDHVLRIAMGSPGEAQIRVWDDVAAQYMKAHPETKVELNYQQDDLYQTIGLPNLLHEILRRHTVIENGGNGGGGVQAVDHRLEVRPNVAVPVRRGVHRTRRPQAPAMARVPQVHGFERHGHFEEPPQLRKGIFIVLPFRGDGKYYVIVAKALGVAEPVQCVGHRATPVGSAAAAGASAPGFVTRPNPILVFARSSL